MKKVKSNFLICLIFVSISSCFNDEPERLERNFEHAQKWFETSGFSNYSTRRNTGVPDWKNATEVTTANSTIIEVPLNLNYNLIGSLKDGDEKYSFSKLLFQRSKNGYNFYSGAIFNWTIKE